MKLITVSEVNRYSPEDECAAVTLVSENGEIVAFSHPCSLKAGDTIPNRLSILDGKVCASSKVESSTQELERTGTYAYRGCGLVINQAEGLVEVLGFVIEFGEMPCDGLVEFEIERLDVRII